MTLLHRNRFFERADNDFDPRYFSRADPSFLYFILKTSSHFFLIKLYFNRFDLGQENIEIMQYLIFKKVKKINLLYHFSIDAVF